MFTDGARSRVQCMGQTLSENHEYMTPRIDLEGTPAQIGEQDPVDVPCDAGRLYTVFRPWNAVNRTMLDVLQDYELQTPN